MFTPVYFFHSFFTLVYLFDSKNVSLGNSICRYLMFLHVSFFMSVYLSHGLVPCLPFFNGQDISFCYTTSENWCSFSRLEYFVFLCQRQERKVFLTSFLQACMSANFMDWYLDYLFHIENVSFYYSICKIFFLFRFAYFFHACLLFMLIDTLSTFITVRICCSDTL